MLSVLSKTVFVDTIDEQEAAKPLRGAAPWSSMVTYRGAKNFRKKRAATGIHAYFMTAHAYVGKIL